MILFVSLTTSGQAQAVDIDRKQHAKHNIKQHDLNSVASDDKKLEADILSQLGVEVTPAYEKEGLHSEFLGMDPDVSFAQTNSKSDQMEKEKSKEKTNAASESTSTSTQSTGSKFFYVDDFFYWLGCKFVTCDKPKSPESQKDSSLSVTPHLEKKEPKIDHKSHHKEESTETIRKTEIPKNATNVSRAQTTKQDAIVDDDDKDTDEDKKEMDEAEKSLNAKSVNDLNKIQQEFKKNATQTKPAQKPAKVVATVQTKPPASINSKQNATVLPQSNTNMTKRFQQRKQPVKNSSAKEIHVNASNKKNATLVSTKQNATKPAPALVAASSAAPVGSKDTIEAVDFAKKNPFGDFSSFEESIDQMQPIVPEFTADELEKKIKDRKEQMVKLQQEQAKMQEQQMTQQRAQEQEQRLLQEKQMQEQKIQQERQKKEQEKEQEQKKQAEEQKKKVEQEKQKAEKIKAEQEHKKAEQQKADQQKAEQQKAVQLKLKLANEKKALEEKKQNQMKLKDQKAKQAIHLAPKENKTAKIHVQVPPDAPQAPQGFKPVPQAPMMPMRPLGAMPLPMMPQQRPQQLMPAPQKKNIHLQTENKQAPQMTQQQMPLPFMNFPQPAPINIPSSFQYQPQANFNMDGPRLNIQGQQQAQGNEQQQGSMSLQQNLENMFSNPASLGFQDLSKGMQLGINTNQPFNFQFPANIR